MTKQCRDIEQLAPLAQTACKLFMSRCKSAGLNIFITETYRSQERQNELYAQGRTKPGNKVTWTLKSRHTSRMAWDIACEGKELYNDKIIAQCGKIATQLGITWGGTWKTPDTPHFEIDKNWKQPKEDNAMTADERREFEYLKEIVNSLAEENQELKKRVKQLENPMIYNYIDENMPQWARPTIQKLVGRGLLAGNEKGELGLTDSDLKQFVINDRAGLYK